MRSAYFQCVVHFRPSSNPAAPRRKEPEHRLSMVAPSAWASRSACSTVAGYSSRSRTCVGAAMTRSLPASASSPWLAVIVNGETFLVSNGTPGRSAQTRKSKVGTPSSERSRPKTSTATPNSNTAIGSTSTTLTLDSAMPSSIVAEILRTPDSCQFRSTRGGQGGGVRLEGRVRQVAGDDRRHLDVSLDQRTGTPVRTDQPLPILAVDKALAVGRALSTLLLDQVVGPQVALIQPDEDIVRVQEPQLPLVANGGLPVEEGLAELDPIGLGSAPAGGQVGRRQHREGRVAACRGQHRPPVDLLDRAILRQVGEQDGENHQRDQDQRQGANHVSRCRRQSVR